MALCSGQKKSINNLCNTDLWLTFFPFLRRRWFFGGFFFLYVCHKGCHGLTNNLNEQTRTNMSAMGCNSLQLPAVVFAVGYCLDSLKLLWQSLIVLIFHGLCRIGHCFDLFWILWHLQNVSGGKMTVSLLFYTIYGPTTSSFWAVGFQTERIINYLEES